ncbi:MAG TPA: hypothetical protein DCY34_02785 [Rhodobacteraceae bacterium]|nr:hypothetical protein [Paracoccaceae bacterium]
MVMKGMNLFFARSSLNSSKSISNAVLSAAANAFCPDTVAVRCVKWAPAFAKICHPDCLTGRM